MCKYCELRDDLAQSCLREGITSHIYTPHRIYDWEVRVYDYPNSNPKLAITSEKRSLTCIYIPIQYCPMCGRKLGK